MGVHVRGRNSNVRPKAIIILVFLLPVVIVLVLLYCFPLDNTIFNTNTYSNTNCLQKDGYKITYHWANSIKAN